MACKESKKFRPQSTAHGDGLVQYFFYYGKPFKLRKKRAAHSSIQCYGISRMVAFLSHRNVPLF